MNATWLNGAPGRCLALLLPCAIAALLWMSLVEPLSDWYSALREQAATRTAMADRMEMLVGTLPTLRQQAERADQDKPPLGQAGSDAAASAALQVRLQSLSASAGVTLSSVETLPPDQMAGMRRIGLRLALTAPWPAQVRFLEAVQGGASGLLIDDLHIHSIIVANRATTAPPLQTTLRVYALRSATLP